MELGLGRMLHQVFYLLVVTAHVLTDVDVPITVHWNGGFQGEACFPITEEMHSWTVVLTFDQPLTSLDAYTADVTASQDGGKVYVLHNKAWNKDEHVGDKLCLGFQGHGHGDIAPKVTGSIHAGDYTFQNTTAPHTQTATTHIQTTASTHRSTTATTHRSTPPTTHRVTTPTTHRVTTPTTHRVTTPTTYRVTTPTTHRVTTPTTHRVTTPTKSTTHSVPFAVTPAPGNRTTTPHLSSIKVIKDWGERFAGVFNFTIHEDVLGWVMNVTFSKGLAYLELPDGEPKFHSADGKQWMIVNKDYHSAYHPGDTLSIMILGNYRNGGGAPTAQAVLTNMGVDNWRVNQQPDDNKSKYNYNDVIYKSILFYEAQRSGKLPPSNRIPYRGDSAINDTGNGHSLSGGWYNGGDHVKFNFPMAFSTTMLAWGYLLYKDAYQSAGQEDYLLDSIKWPLNYLLKCHTKPEELYVQVGDPKHDHYYWGPPELLRMNRPAYQINATHPGTDVAMETAAAFAAGSLVFKDKDPGLAATLLTHAKQLWDFGNKYHGIYSNSIKQAEPFYKSNNFTDELCWGSLWLYQVTNDAHYLTEAEKNFDPSPAWSLYWDDKTLGNQILLYKLTKNDKYKVAAEASLVSWFPGGSVPYTPKGLAHRNESGSLSHSANIAFAALVAADAGINPPEYRRWAMCQIHYGLGDTGFSYVIGFGDRYPLRPHHRSSSCPILPAICGPFMKTNKDPNVHILYGALVGGPDQSDNFVDDRVRIDQNDVACDFNAGLQSAVAGLKSLWLRSEHPEQKHDATCPYQKKADEVVGRK
ncbi:unnamed protein product [Lymnaea stagnalis]|uniref:cellulase n=1 Tax=Lymnaea stagnalis TaxID=6523 RepID=A0AAV2HIL6_LYMST